MITHQLLKLESPNLVYRCKRPCLRNLLFCGVIDLDLRGQVQLESRILPHFELVRMITCHPFKLELSNLDQKCISVLLKSLLFYGWSTMTFKVKFNLKVKIYPIFLYYIYTYRDWDWHTDMTRTSVRIMSLSTGSHSYQSHPCQIRHGLQGQICPFRLFWDSQNNWHGQISVSNPYRLHVISALHPCCPCHICITSMAYPSTNSHTHMARMWHGHDTDAVRL